MLWQSKVTFAFPGCRLFAEPRHWKRRARAARVDVFRGARRCLRMRCVPAHAPTLPAEARARTHDAASVPSAAWSRFAFIRLS